MNYYKVSVLMLNVIALNVICCQAVEHIVQEEWIEPNAWERKVTVERKTDYINLPKDIHKNVDNEVAFLYYKKIINNLFGRDKLQYNAKMGRYCRSLVFHVMPTQLIKLESDTDPRELDLILQELILNAHTSNVCEPERNPNSKSSLGFLGLLWDIVKDIWQLLKTSELQVSLLGTLCVIVAWLCYCRYGLRGVFTFVILGSIVFGYYITYLECNRSLETESQLELLAEEEEEQEGNWFSRIQSFFPWGKTEQKSLRKKLLKSHKVRLQFCRPDHVLLMYGNDIFLKQIEVLIEKCVSTIETINSRMIFPFNLVAASMVIYMIGFIIKLTFKYLINPTAWFGIINSTSNANFSQTSTTRLTQQSTEPTEDRISGENLKVLLNLMKNSHSQILKNMATNASGVQEVLEQLDAPTTTTHTHSKSNSPHKNEKKISETLNNNHEVEQLDAPTSTSPTWSKSIAPHKSEEQITENLENRHEVEHLNVSTTTTPTKSKSNSQQGNEEQIRETSKNSNEIEQLDTSSTLTTNVTSTNSKLNSSQSETFSF